MTIYRKYFIVLLVFLFSSLGISKEIIVTKKDFKNGNDNLSEVLLQADSEPYKDPKTKNTIGFKIIQIEKGSVYEKLQLNVGDVITAVNDQPLLSVADAAQIYAQDKLEQLMGSGDNSYKVNLIRNNKKIIFIYRIK